MRRFILFVLIVAICVYGLYRWTEKRPEEQFPQHFTPAAGPKLSYDDVNVLEEMEKEYTRLVQAVVPSVVSIVATKRVEAPAVVDPFELFFGGRARMAPQTEEMRSLGSGVIVSKEGHIVTNQHVVADVDEVSIRFSDGQTVPAQIIGSDPVSDIAVLKVSGVKVTPLAFGDSDQVKVGQRVIAVGNPFGFDETVTQGIISAKGRAIEASANEFFQTDAAINPGNSGGPLVDIRGEIIGINAAILEGQESGGWEGVGFAIPSNTARRALDEIIKTGRVSHGYLGVEIMTPEEAASKGMQEIDGAYVKGVRPGSPAEKAGIQKEDVITSIGAQPVHSFNDLHNQIVGLEAGSQVNIGLKRDGKAMTLTAQIDELPQNESATDEEQQPSEEETPPPGAGPSLLAGIDVTEIPPDHEEDLPPNAHGVMVASVDDNSPASGTLQQSDVIEEIDHVPIHSVAEYKQALSEITGSRVLLLICRDGHRSFALVTEQ